MFIVFFSFGPASIRLKIVFVSMVVRLQTMESSGKICVVFTHNGVSLLACVFLSFRFGFAFAFGETRFLCNFLTIPYTYVHSCKNYDDDDDSVLVAIQAFVLIN